MDVLIAGGGVAALEALLALRRLAEERVSITLLTPEPDFVYKPLLVAEPFDLGHAYRFDLAEIVAQQSAELKVGRLLGVDPSSATASTWTGEVHRYDALLVACGGRPEAWLSGAFTFGLDDSSEMRRVLAGLEAGVVREVAFVVPEPVSWPLPIYELALMSAARLEKAGTRDATLTIVTAEAAALELFGEQASGAVEALLADRGIRLMKNARSLVAREGYLELAPGARLPADWVVTLPRLVGPGISGLPVDAGGFIAVDEHCRVTGEDAVYAAGDATSFAVKQGGIAAQQADAAAEHIARRSGADLEPHPFKPVLRGLLLTGEMPEFLRNELTDEQEGSSVASAQPLWWPPGKITGRYLSPYLAAITERALPPLEPEVDTSMRIEIRLSGRGSY
jgi:sulfide:quinone oxidoreductase